ncbi:hypothetical protein F5884DRAFT_684142 [Xylogone sp. PMI_703]|nr:hypothetical protein F5884DRAFT_684142 [Xylogone sp. PMI_703]
MEPLTALSFAGTIIQFVDFGTKLLSKTSELYKSSVGTLQTNDELELVTTDLRGLVTKLKVSNCSNGEPEDSYDGIAQQTSFSRLCDEAAVLAEELIGRLEKLKVKDGKRRIWRSLKQAIETAWSEKEVASMKQRLLSFREALETRVLFSIRFLLSRIGSLDRSEHLQIRRTMFQEICEKAGIESLHSMEDNVGEIVAKIEMLDVSAAAELRTRESVHTGILQSLYYPAMSERYEEVQEAHAETFEWAFHDLTAEQQTWSNLSRWLKGGEGVYWVSGKAGSGKSTFMKYIYDDGRTRGHLRKWANGTPLCVATFFFWNSGTKEQKSQSGLFRALLFQVLEKHPELGPVVFPAIWTKLYSKAVSQLLEQSTEPTVSWSLKQLKAGFRALIYQKQIPLKICFLIDGLDEFDGDHEEIAGLFQEISRFENIKVCLSSRPWVIFQYLFEGSPNLRLQNLTYPDIERYVQDKLARNSAFQRLAEQEEEAAHALMREIVDKADGVFLWVKLVVGSLLNGIRNRDEMSHLWERLRLLPRELEPLYSRLLDLVEPIYLVWVSKTFQILRNNRDLSEFPFPESPGETRCVEGLSVLGFYLAMNSDFSMETMKNIHPDTLEHKLEAKCADTIVQLTARCAGLLEVSNMKGKDTTGAKSFIRYFHRTAQDFLHTDTYWSKIQMQTANSEFNPNVCMMQSCILQAMFNYKCHQEPKSLTGPFAELDMEHLVPRCKMDEETTALAKDFMIYAYHADTQTEAFKAQSVMIDQFNNLLVDNWINHLYPSLLGFPAFLELAAMYNLKGYTRLKLNSQTKEHAGENATALLRYMLPDRDCYVMHGLPFPQVEMVSILL